MRGSDSSATATSRMRSSTNLGLAYACSVTHFSSARLSRPQSSLEALCSATRTSSLKSMGKAGSRSSTRMLMNERWLCAPLSETSLEQGHSDLTGTTACKLRRVWPSRCSAIHWPSYSIRLCKPDTGAALRTKNGKLTSIRPSSASKSANMALISVLNKGAVRGTPLTSRDSSQAIRRDIWAPFFWALSATSSVQWPTVACSLPATIKLSG